MNRLPTCRLERPPAPLRLAAGLLLVGLMAGCEAEPDPFMVDGGEPLAGGYTPTAVIGDTQIACNVAMEAVYDRQPSAATIEVVAAQVQVVAGLNHRCLLSLAGEEAAARRYRVTVYQDLDRTFTVTDFAELP